MNVLLLILRLVHIGLGIFWAGAVLFMVLYLEPSVRAAGPNGASVLRGLQERRLMTVLPIVALLTVVTGFVLYSLLWGGPAAASPAGMSFGIGGLAATAALLVGFFIMRAAQVAAFRLGSAVASMTDGVERAKATEELERLRSRARTAGRWVAVLVGIAVVTMAIARYL